MAIRFSPTIEAKPCGTGDGFSAKGVNLYERGEQASPVAVLDDFRVSGRPFPPHPHAGFSALTYVFEEFGERRSKPQPLGNDIVVGPGGIVGFRLLGARSTKKSQQRSVVSCTALRSSST